MPRFPHDNTGTTCMHFIFLLRSRALALAEAAGVPTPCSRVAFISYCWHIFLSLLACFHLVSCSNSSLLHSGTTFSPTTVFSYSLFQNLEGWCWIMPPFGSEAKIIPFSALQWLSDFIWDWSSDSHKNLLLLFSASFLSPHCAVWETWRSHSHLGKHAAFWARLKTPQLCEKSWA